MPSAGQDTRPPFPSFSSFLHFCSSSSSPSGRPEGIMGPPPVRGLAPSTQVLVVGLLLAAGMQGGQGVYITEIQVPSMVQAGETVELGCLYNLEGLPLYSLNWWRGSDQFYQFSPDGEGQQLVYEMPGISVDVERSGRDTVVLRNVSQASAGLYKCEVLADYPSFEKDSDTADMEVIDPPSRNPDMYLGRLQWSPGEILEANCTSPGARPPPQLLWYINGNMILSQFSRLVEPEVDPSTVNIPNYYINGGRNDYEEEEEEEEEEDEEEEEKEVYTGPQTSELKMRLTEGHFINSGQATLSCAATLPGLYHRPSEVYITLPGFRAAAPSQKLYGGALRSGTGTPVLALLLGGLALLVL